MRREEIIEMVEKLFREARYPVKTEEMAGYLVRGCSETVYDDVIAPLLKEKVCERLTDGKAEE